jgi:hypothetical protein
MGLTWVMHEPWQIGIFHEEMEGKVLWYPSGGTLVFEDADGRFSRIGEKGQFLAGGWHANEGPKYVTEDVYNEIQKIVDMQNPMTPAPKKVANDDTCYLEYVEGYLTCTAHHAVGEPCLMDNAPL